MTKEKLTELINDMSLEEKICQLLQVAGNFYDKESLVTGGLDYFKVTDREKELAGSILSISGAEKLKKLQDELMEKQPHHIPQVFMLDIINGYETIYTVPLGQGASFNPELSEKLARMAAKEGAAAGIHVTFSPMADLCRDSRWGRVMESTGEDSYLNGLMAAAMVKGYQGDDIKKKGNLAACVKHFAGYGGAEGGRDYDNVELSERTLRNEYLTAYKEAIDAGVKLVMTSFNTLNQVPSTGNKWLMRDILRDEMGFDGVLISDYGALKEMIAHNIAKDEEQAAELAINAGVDMDMMSLCYVHGLKALVESGKVSEKLIDEAVERILVLKNELGLFENPYKDASVEDEERLLLCEEHRNLVREAAVESFILLENEDNILPFNKDDSQTIAFMGPYADEKRVYGSWVFPKSEEGIVSVKDGVERFKTNNKTVFCKGSQLLSYNRTFKDGTEVKYNPSLKEKLLNEAVEIAKKTDKVVLCLGEHPHFTGEAASRVSLSIPDEQMDLLRAVSKVNKNIVTLVFAGRPIELLEVKNLSKAVMFVWFPGTETGNAITDVLWGETDPKGRVPMSFPYTAAQMPCYYNRFVTGRPNDGTLNQHFVNGYIDQIDKMLYPFGYGKSYTEFEYGTVKLSGGVNGDGKQLSKEKTVIASTTVKNTGTVVGTETVQLYVSDLYGSVVRPRIQLKGFEKITLNPGETKTVSFEVSEEMFRFYNINMEYVSEPGDCRVYIGSDSDTNNYAEFEIV